MKEEKKITILVEKAKNGNREAFNEIIEEYQKMVTKIAYSFTRNYQDAEDIANEVFVKAFFKLNTLKDNSQIKSWLYSITVNIARNFLKKEKFRILSLNEAIYSDYNSNNVENEILYNELNNIINEEIKKLPHKQQVVFILKKDQNLKFKEIAEILHISESAVKTHFFRALKRIKERLKKEGYYNG